MGAIEDFEKKAKELENHRIDKIVNEACGKHELSIAKNRAEAIEACKQGSVVSGIISLGSLGAGLASAVAYAKTGKKGFLYATAGATGLGVSSAIIKGRYDGCLIVLDELGDYFFEPEDEEPAEDSKADAEEPSE